jgi:fructokinase
MLCYCGQHGCLETWISGTGLEWDFARTSSRNLRGAEIVQAAEAGDVEAQQALERLIDRMARGLSTIVNVLDPDAIVLGGGLSNLGRCMMASWRGGCGIMDLEAGWRRRS